MNYRVIVTLVFLGIAAVLCTRLLSGAEDVSAGIMIVLSIVLIVATFLDTNIGLIAILLSMLLSPELEAGATAGRSIIIRAEDLLLIIVSVTWLAKMAIKKDVPVIRPSPLNIPIGIYTAILCLSTLRGMIAGNVVPAKGMFYVLKIFEYFVLYFMVLNHTTSVKQVKLFLGITIFTCFVVGIWGNTHIGTGRLSAPFEGSGEPNTLGGYILFVLCMIAGLILYYKEKRRLFTVLFIFLLPTFIFTLSRVSYMAFIPAMIAFVLLSKRKEPLIFVFLLFISLVVVVLLGPPYLKDRIVDTFRPIANQEHIKFGPVALGPSPASRVSDWKDALTRWFPQRPFLGSGVTGAYFMDGQYFVVLVETGMIGLFVFLWLMRDIWSVGLKTYNHVETPLFKGLALGYLAGFVGLLFHAIGSNTFIIIRIAEPFWFFTAIVVKLVDIETGKAMMDDMARTYKIR